MIVYKISSKFQRKEVTQVRPLTKRKKKATPRPDLEESVRRINRGEKLPIEEEDEISDLLDPDLLELDLTPAPAEPPLKEPTTILRNKFSEKPEDKLCQFCEEPLGWEGHIRSYHQKCIDKRE